MPINAASPKVFADQAWSPCKVCDAVDFFRPEVIKQIRRVGEEPRLHTKQWEYAQLLQTIDSLVPRGAAMVGLGCGAEKSIPLLAEHAGEITATDLYGMSGAWSTAQKKPDELWPELKNLRVHPMSMVDIDLADASADFVWSLCSVEHVGKEAAVLDAIRQAGRLLRPNGLFFLSTEYTFDSEPFYWSSRRSQTQFFTRSLVERVLKETDLHLYEPLDLRVSSHPMNVPVLDQIDSYGYANLPHVLYRFQPDPLRGTYGGCLSLLLCREDRGADRIIEDPDQAARLKPLFELGRKTSRRLTSPKRWWFK